MKTHLKIKIISLAEESKAIRRHENKFVRTVTYSYVNPKTGETKTKSRVVKQAKGWGKDHPLRMDLMRHRKGFVRVAARVAQLAYAFLRETPYAVAENYTRDNYHGFCGLLRRVETEALKFSTHLDPRVTKQKFAAWQDAAEAHHKRTPWEIRHGSGA